MTARTHRSTNLSLAALAALALASASATAATLYSETFSGGSETLHASTPDITTGGAAWSSQGWNKNGTVDAGTDADNAFLAFTPTVGKVYTLSATLTQPSGASWAAIGFTENSNVAIDFWENTPTVTAPWVLYRAAAGNVDSFLGPLTGGVEDEGDHPGGISLSILLNTEGAAWTAEWFVNGGSVRSETFASNPTGINYVGLGRENNTDVIFSSFSLTVIPEPSVAALFGLGGLALLRRRRK